MVAYGWPDDETVCVALYRIDGQIEMREMLEEEGERT